MDIIVLDTGDNYIISLKDSNYDTALKLYSMMDITINPIETGIRVYAEVAQFIFDNIGRVISYGFNDTDASVRIDVLGRLLEDIKKAIDFYKVRRFWSGVALKQKYEDRSMTSLEGINSPSDSLSCGIDLTNTQFHITTPREIDFQSHNKYVIYNSLYGLSMIATCHASLPKSFPDFHIMFPVASSNKQIDSAFEQHFHKISFDSKEDIMVKYEAFKQLYNIAKTREKDKVKQYLYERYTISDNVDERMKANDLYKELINVMYIPYNEVSLFKKRVSGYLLEFGLQKKRYSDAYYYYGMVSKAPSSINLAELEKTRDEQRKEWFYKKCVTSNPTEIKKTVDTHTSSELIPDYVR